MQYYLSLDGGGSKTHALLFDEALHLTAWASGGCINPNVCPVAEVQKNLHNCFSALFAQRHPARLAHSYVCAVGSADLARQVLSQFVLTDAFTELYEGEMAMLAAGVYNNALVVIAGTGVNISYYKDNALGPYASGWGALVYDGGSGYSVGRMALQAAIAHAEQYGPFTGLTEAFCAHFGVTQQEFSRIGHVLFARASPAREIAALAPLTAQCAEQGDAVAHAVLTENAAMLHAQVQGYLRRFPFCGAFPLVTGGGAWKLAVLRSTFAALLRESHPAICCAPQLFDPVIGGVFALLRDKRTAAPPLVKRLQTEFSPFAFTQTQQP